MAHDHPVVAAAALAGGDGEQITRLPQLDETVHHPRVEGRGLPVEGGIVAGVALPKRRELTTIEGGKQRRKGLPETEPDHFPPRLRRRGRQPPVPGGQLQALNDTGQGIGQGAIPVEDQQRGADAHGRRSRKWARSSGRGDSTVIASPEGSTKRSRWAWRNMRLSPAARARSLSSSRPYLSSPSNGWPANWQCTRIWWVRPVSSPTSNRVAAAKRFTTRKWVTACLPATSARTIRSPSPTVVFSRGASMRSRPLGQLPTTRQR